MIFNRLVDRLKNGFYLLYRGRTKIYGVFVLRDCAHRHALIYAQMDTPIHSLVQKPIETPTRKHTQQGSAAVLGMTEVEGKKQENFV